MRNLGKPVDLAGQYYLDGADEVCLSLGKLTAFFVTYRLYYLSLTEHAEMQSITATQIDYILSFRLVF